MELQLSKKPTGLEFLNITHHLQRKDATFRKAVRSQAAKSRKHLKSCGPAWNNERQFRPAKVSPGLSDHGLESSEYRVELESCSQCGGTLPLRRHAKDYIPPQDVNSKTREECPIKQSCSCSFSSLERNSRGRLGSGDRDPFSSFPVPAGQS